MNAHHNFHRHSRRSFLKTTACLTLGSVVVGSHSLAAALEGNGELALVVSPEDDLASAVPPQWALGELETALKAQGATVRRVAKLTDATTKEFCVVAAGMNATLARRVCGSLSHRRRFLRP
jgi:hypothetical protein